MPSGGILSPVTRAGRAWKKGLVGSTDDVLTTSDVGCPDGGCCFRWNIALLFVVPFVLYSVVVVAILVRRRKTVSLSQLRSSGVVSDHVPSGRPLAVARGAAWVGGRGLSYGPSVLFELYETTLVLRSSSADEFTPIVIERTNISRLKIARGLLGVSLRIFDQTDTEINVDFRVYSKARLRRTLSEGGWIGLLTNPDGAG
jgi:hypothetical protein